MNARKLLAGLSLGLFCHTIQAGEPIADLDKFEASYIACIEDEKAFADRCLTELFAKHSLPWEKPANLGKLEDALEKWMGTVYKVHPITRKSSGEVFQKRWYLIENDAGKLMQLTVRFRTVKGQWYYLGINMTNDEKDLGPITLYDATAP
ncbi:hypothetical protein [Pseudomonas sp. F(2018)]|uniref:hypothetical protein n=1 Tax=Pseudomonas sp. F(2018) TaxID=2502240 RepID=UPI0010F6E282|nr:hypothetical protein [Pseudomonas sp. F(2018)]